jgi:beta-galactosidase
MRAFVLTLLLLCNGIAFAGRTLFDEDWKFVLSDPKGAEDADFDDGGWRMLDLPHGWSVEGKFDRKNPSGDRSGYLPPGIGWYRKSIDLQITLKRGANTIRLSAVDNAGPLVDEISIK